MKCRSLLAVAIALAVSAGAAMAQSAAISATGPSAATVRAYWTPARLAAAKPMDLQASVRVGAVPSLTITPATQISGEGAAPTITAGPVNEFLYKVAEVGGAELQVSPRATSSFNAFFTTSRVFPDSSTIAYPWRATGKLFFTNPGEGDFICSASVIGPRIIATAGHCVFNASSVASQRHFHTNFLFVPAFRQIPPAGAVAPFCRWTVGYKIVAGAWSNGNGSVPNAQDVALMEAIDQKCTSTSTLQKIGSVTGFYGFRTNSLMPQSITQIGYPKNLDGGLRMEVTWAQSFQSGGNNTVIIGSAQRGGASGGPWLKDFGVNPVDSANHPAVSRNQLVSVTSYGPTSEAPQYLGGSILDSRFVGIRNTICAHSAGNC